MSLIKTAQPVESITGSIAGNVFTGDSAGKHIRANPRRVRRCSSAQKKQRDAFRKARRYSTDNRTLSYYIYRVLNNLPIAPELITPAHLEVTGDPAPDCRGNYFEAGIFWVKPYYTREDNEWAIWFHEWWPGWIISVAQGTITLDYWVGDLTLEGDYDPWGEATGIATVTCYDDVWKTYDVPPDYNPPNL